MEGHYVLFFHIKVITENEFARSQAMTKCKSNYKLQSVRVHGKSIKTLKAISNLVKDHKMD